MKTRISYVLLVGILLNASIVGVNALAGTETEAIHPDLIVPPEAYDDEVLVRIQEVVASTVQEGENPEDGEIFIPDYRYAYEVLQDAIASALWNYFEKMDQIATELRVYYSKIWRLEQEAHHDAFFKSLLKEEIIKITGPLSIKINSLYSDAITKLYLLPNDFLKYNLSRNKDVLWGSSDTRTPSIFNFCRTSACVHKLEQDIASWYDFVTPLNTKIRLIDPKNRQWLQIEPSGLVPIVSRTMGLVARHLIALEGANRPAGLVALMGELAEVPGGIALGGASVPVYLLEKIVIFGRELASLELMRVKLELKSLDAFPKADILKALARVANEKSYILPTVIYDLTERTRIEKEVALAASQAIRSLQVSTRLQISTSAMDFVDLSQAVEQCTMNSWRTLPKGGICKTEAEQHFMIYAKSNRGYVLWRHIETQLIWMNPHRSTVWIDVGSTCKSLSDSEVSAYLTLDWKAPSLAELKTLAAAGLGEIYDNTFWSTDQLDNPDFAYTLSLKWRTIRYSSKSDSMFILCKATP